MPVRWERFLCLLLCVPACQGGAAMMSPPPDLASPFACRTDDDCEGQPQRRVCVAQECTDPGCPAGTSYLAAGSFTMGCDEAEPDCDQSAQPAHTVTLSHALCVSKTELSVAAYRSCVSAGSCLAPVSLRCTQDTATWSEQPAGKESFPINCLQWEEADSACKFLGGRLPTEAEWEKAARGYARRSFAWGRAAPIGCDQGVNWAGIGCLGKLWEAQSLSRPGAMLSSAAKAVDMAGNVWDWTADYYAPDSYLSCKSGCIDPQVTTPGILRSRRGGGFMSATIKELRTYFRDFDRPANRYDGNGARCVFPAPLIPRS